jgi:hypothetical protein
LTGRERIFALCRGTRYRPAPYPPRPTLEPPTEGARVLVMRVSGKDVVAAELHGPTVSKRGLRDRPAGYHVANVKRRQRSNMHPAPRARTAGLSSILGHLWRRHPN